MLYELLRGHAPFRGSTPLVVLRQHAELPMPPLPPEVPERVAAVIKRCLAKDPASRYQSAAELDEALAGLLRLVIGAGRASGPNVDAITLDLALADGSAPRHNLPAQLSSFVGREREVAAVRQLVAANRLVTLTGPGGVGKSRLALAVAATLVGADFQDGVYFVDLAPLRDPELVVVNIAHTLGVRGAGSLLDLVGQHLRERHTLLLLDNFEQILPAAAIIASLLERCPRLQVMSTSRAPLRITGEQVYPVPPLELPDPFRPSSPGALADVPSVSLFVQRARAVQPDFGLTEDTARTVAEICARLDGLPLAIELASARVRVLSPHGILARVDNRLALLTAGPRDQPQRHQALRAAIDWSYELLSEAEQALFRRLAIFSGGFTVEATEAVCLDEGGLDLDVLDGLTSLLDCSLLRPRAQESERQSRLGMLETIREYALGRLRASGELDSVAARHARYFVDVAERGEYDLRGPDQVAVLERLASDNDNFRAALDWAAQGTGVTEGLRIGGALWRYWMIRAEYAEPRARLERLLSLAPGERTHERAKALASTARFAQYQGDLDPARRLFEESLSIQRERDNRPAIAFTVARLASMAAGRDERELARRLSEEAVAVARTGGIDWVLAHSLYRLGELVHLDGERPRGRALCEEGLTVWRQLGDHRGVAGALLSLGGLVHVDGDAAAALPLLEEAVAKLRLVGERAWLPAALAHLALAELDLRQRSAAIAHLEESLLVARASGNGPGIAMALEGFACVLVAEGRREQAGRLSGAVADVAGWRRFPLLLWGAQVERRLTPPLRQAAPGDPPIQLEQAILEALALAPDRTPSSRHPESGDLTPTVSLTSREQEVVALVRQGLTSRHIAELLVVSERTINTHLEHIRHKLGVRSRAEIVARTLGSDQPPDRPQPV